MKKCKDFRNCFESKSPLCSNGCRDYGIDNRQKAAIRGKNNRKIIFQNPKGRLLSCYKLDENHVIKDQRENENVCDNLLLILSDSRQAVFVELKGGHINEAVNQIRQTVDVLKDDLSGFTLHGRIVNTKVPRVINMRDFNNLKLKFLNKGNNGTLEMRRDGYDLDDIEKL